MGGFVWLLVLESISPAVGRSGVERVEGRARALDKRRSGASAGGGGAKNGNGLGRREDQRQAASRVSEWGWGVRRKVSSPGTKTTKRTYGDR